MNNGRQLPTTRRPGLHVGRGGGLLDRGLYAQSLMTLGQFLRQREYVLVGQLGSLKVEHARARVANLLPEITPRPKHAQRTPIVKLIRGHFALLCA
jgi:hypothetical protein